MYFSFVDDVMFSRKGANSGQNQRSRMSFVEFTRWCPWELSCCLWLHACLFMQHNLVWFKLTVTETDSFH